MSRRWKDVSQEYQEKAMKFWDGLVTWNHYDHVQWEFVGYIDPKITDIDPETEILTAKAAILPTVKDDHNEIASIIFDMENEKFKTEVFDLGNNLTFEFESPEPQEIIDGLAEHTALLVKKTGYKGGSPIFERIANYGINPY